jgi:hypothetical protein
VFSSSEILRSAMAERLKPSNFRKQSTVTELKNVRVRIVAVHVRRNYKLIPAFGTVHLCRKWLTARVFRAFVKILYDTLHLQGAVKINYFIYNQAFKS